MTLVIEPGDSSRLQAVPVRWILQDAAQTAKRSPLVADASGSSPAACTSWPSWRQHRHREGHHRPARLLHEPARPPGL